MKKLITISLLSALALGGVAVAQGSGHHGRMLEKLDQNHDGKLTKAEVQSGALARFNKLDANKDGKIDVKELGADLNDRFETMDVNGDGVVDAAEIASGFKHAGPCGHGSRGEHGERGHDRG